MQYAIKDDKRIEATKDATALCPCCSSIVVAKCGLINVHHWAHKTARDCDPWYEPESSWHRTWKERVDSKYREITIIKENETHRADIQLPDHTVIELQHSPISPEDIFARESFYQKMIWIIDGESFSDRFITYNKGDYYTFRWKHAHKAWHFATCPLYIDFGGDTLFLIRKIHVGDTVGGWGEFRKYEDVLKL